MTDGGTYTLAFAVPADRRVEVGALGARRFPAGGYAYTGSALGPGGFSRIDRHRRVAAARRAAVAAHREATGRDPIVDVR